MTSTINKIESKHVRIQKLANDYIINAVDCSGYDKECNTTQDKLQFVMDCFKSEYCYPENLNRYGSYQNTFAQWLMGLPSSFNIDYGNNRIIEIAKEWGSIPQDANDKQEDKILNGWWNFIAAKTFQLMAKHGIRPI